MGFLNQDISSKSDLERIISRDVASQVPMNVTRKSYAAMSAHCITQFVNDSSIWACAKNGARVKAKAVFMNIFSAKTGQLLERAPVLHLYCSGCDKAPQVHGNDPIFDIEIQTLAV